MARPALTRMRIEPPQALAVRDHADLLVLGLEDGPLLDVVFEIGVHPAGADRLVADPADAPELVAEALALAVLAAIGVVERVDAGEDARGQHGGGEAGAFLVGPVDHDDRPARPDAEVVEGADDFEAAQHAEHAVIAAAGRLRVEMAADIDRIEARVGAFAAREHGAHLVEAHAEPGALAPRFEQRSAPGVVVGQRLPIAAPGHPRPDLGQLVNGIPQPVGINAEVFTGRGHHRFLAVAVRSPRSSGERVAGENRQSGESPGDSPAATRPISS